MGTTGQVVIAVDQSASIESKKSAIGWAIFIDCELSDYGERYPHYPDFKEDRDWLRSAIEWYTNVLDGSAPKNDVCVAVETVYFNKKFFNPRLFERLVAVKEHMHAVASDMGCVYLEIHPRTSEAVLTGRGGRRSAERKAAMIESASREIGEQVSEHVADAYGIGLAAIAALKLTTEM